MRRGQFEQKPPVLQSAKMLAITFIHIINKINRTLNLLQKLATNTKLQ
jgi:hypothetical protein